MPKFPAYKHWIEFTPTEGFISFRLFTIDNNTNILVTEDYSIPNPPTELNISLLEYVDANFDMIAAQDKNISKLQS